MANPNPLSGYFTEAELAQHWDQHPQTLRKRRRLRKMPPHIRLGKQILYRREAVEEWLREQEAAHAS